MLGSHLKWLKEESEKIFEGQETPLEIAKKRKPSLQLKISLAVVVLALVMLSIDARHTYLWSVLAIGCSLQIIIDIYRIFRSRS